MWKIDMHTHSKGVSLCSHATCEEIVDAKIAQGYDGIVLTNHCQEWYYEPTRHAEFIEKFLQEYEKAKAYAASKHFKVLLGMEVTLNVPFYSDWLLYGVTETFLRNSPCLYRLTQKELFGLCCANGVLLVQAHPYRQAPADPRYMHGIEINCTAGDLQLKDKVIELARENRLTITCGTDYHGKNPFRGGMLLPESVKTSEDLAEYLFKTDKTHVFLESEMLEFSTPSRMER